MPGHVRQSLLEQARKPLGGWGEEQPGDGEETTMYNEGRPDVAGCSPGETVINSAQGEGLCTPCKVISKPLLRKICWQVKGRE